MIVRRSIVVVFIPKPVENPRTEMWQALQREASASFEKCQKTRYGANVRYSIKGAI